jgi:hypothetical protein
MNKLQSYFHPKGGDGADSPPAPVTFSKTDEMELTVGTPALSTVGSSATGDDYPAEMKKEVLVRFLYQEQCHNGFNNGGPEEGVILKKSKGQFTSYPEELQSASGGLFDVATQLNSPVCTPKCCILYASMLNYYNRSSPLSTAIL